MGDNGGGVAGKKHFSLSSILGEQKKKRKKKKAKQPVDKVCLIACLLFNTCSIYMCTYLHTHKHAVYYGGQ